MYELGDITSFFWNNDKAGGCRLLIQDAEFRTNEEEKRRKEDRWGEEKREEGKRREQAREVEERLVCKWQHVTGSAIGAEGKQHLIQTRENDL